MNAAVMQQQSMYIGSEHPRHHVYWGSLYSSMEKSIRCGVGVSAILGGTADRDTLRKALQNKIN
jgi:hypothetical protein